MSGGKGLFLDFDGTLCDSLALLQGVWRDFLGFHGAGFAEEEFELVNGPPIPEVVARLRAHYRLPGRVEDLTADYLARLRAVQGDAPPAPGAEAVLRRARAGGWSVAVVTSNSRVATAAWLKRHGLDGAVGLIVGGEDVTHGKPDAEPYRLALARSGAEAVRSLAVEDGADGARAALAAGLPLVLVGARGLDAAAASPLLRGVVDGLAGLVRFL